MSPMQTEGYSAHFMRIWVAIGVCGLIGMASLPFLLSSVVRGEQDRFLACQKKQRLDCQTSFVWLNNGWALESSDAAIQQAQQKMDTTPSETTRIDQGPAGAPTFVSVKPLNMQLQDHRYLANAGTKVTVQVTVDKAAKVELTVIEHADDGAPFPKYIGTMKQDKIGTWSGDFTVSKNLLGELKLVATSQDGKATTMYVNVGANQPL